MSKKIVVFLLVVFPLLAIAQELKVAHINSQEVLAVMPEREKIEKELNTLQNQWEDQLVKMREEYYAKIKEYQEKQTTMPESIKQARQSEIVEMEQRINTFTQTAGSDLQKKQQEMLSPIIEKVKKAIDEVGLENNYTYIFDLATQSILYTSKSANDITPLVKKKLGIK